MMRGPCQAMLLKTFVDKGLVRRVQEHTTDQTAEFLLRLTPRGVEHLASVAGAKPGVSDKEAAVTHALHREFRLHRNILTTNMHLFDNGGDIKKCVLWCSGCDAGTIDNGRRSYARLCGHVLGVHTSRAGTTT